jgi:mono/diheme cytochrome c family protein
MIVLAPAIAVVLAGCSDTGSAPNPAAERGRQVYLAQCTACHNSDPAQAGPVGPPLKGAAPAVLEAKVVRGTYPPGYAPKRPTSLMPPQPALAPEIPALAAFLK